MKRKRASKTKSAIYEISKSLTQKGCTSADIVTALLGPDFAEVIAADQNDIIEIGLRVRFEIIRHDFLMLRAVG